MAIFLKCGWMGLMEVMAITAGQGRNVRLILRPIMIGPIHGQSFANCNRTHVYLVISGLMKGGVEMKVVIQMIPAGPRIRLMGRTAIRLALVTPGLRKARQVP